MGFLNFLRGKNKRQADKGVKSRADEYFRKLEKYKTLRKLDVASVPDEDVITAVMSWMWAKE